MPMSTAGSTTAPGPVNSAVGPMQRPGCGSLPFTTLPYTVLPAVHTIASRSTSAAAIAASLAPVTTPWSTRSGGRKAPPLKRDRKTCEAPSTRLR